MRRRACVAILTLGAVAGVSCFEAAGPDYSGPERCTQPAGGRTAVSCTTLYGTVVDAAGQRMTGVSGSVRFPAWCDCLSPVITADSNGVFSAMVHRLRPAGTGPDTTTATVALFASDAKYPRHSTGGMYFDTARVALTFVPIGAPPTPVQAALRIPLPLGGF